MKRSRKFISVALAFILVFTFVIPIIPNAPVPVLAANIIIKETVLNGEYDIIGSFREGLAIAEKDGRYGFIDKTGTVVIPFEYDDAWNFSDGLAIMRKDGRWVHIDKTGRVVMPFIGDFSEGLARAQRNDKYGFIDQERNVVIPFEYDYASYFSEGLAGVRKDGKWGFIDKVGNVVIPFEYDWGGSFYEGLAHVRKNDKYGFIDKAGNVVIPFEYDYAYDFNEGLVCVEKNEKKGYIDKKGNIVIPFLYDRAGDFEDGLAIVVKDGKGGFIDKSGNVVIPFIYDSAWPFSDGLASVSIYGIWGFIDKTGNIVVPFEYSSAHSFNEGVASAQRWDGTTVILEIVGYEQITAQEQYDEIEEIKVYLSNKEIPFSQPAFIENGTAFAPVRDLAMALGADAVEWDEIGRTVNIKHGVQIAYLNVDLPIASIVNVDNYAGIRTFNDIETKTIDGVAFAPLRFIAEEVFGARIEYRDEEHAVYITGNTANEISPLEVPEFAYDVYRNLLDSLGVVEASIEVMGIIGEALTVPNALKKMFQNLEISGVSEFSKKMEMFSDISDYKQIVEFILLWKTIEQMRTRMSEERKHYLSVSQDIVNKIDIIINNISDLEKDLDKAIGFWSADYIIMEGLKYVKGVGWITRITVTILGAPSKPFIDELLYTYNIVSNKIKKRAYLT